MERLLADLPRLLQGLSAILVATRDEGLVPACALAAAITADGARRATVYLPEVTGRTIFENVAKNGQIAVTMEQIPTHRTMQLKGRCVEVRAAHDSERDVIERSQEEFFRAVQLIGAPPDVRRRRRWPCRALTFEITEVYEQTPGPRAGLPFLTSASPTSPAPS